ncbi:MAG: XdhC family protein [Chloroflexia bacterium]|nr:XdhC family protein [Chloroflexia bacterium]
MSQQVLHALLDSLRQGKAVALATIIRSQGSVPSDPGAKILVRADGSTEGSIGGGGLEQHVVQDAQAALGEGGHSQIRHYSLQPDGPDALGMLCGGEVDVFIEVHRPQPTLLLIGGGNVGQHLADMAARVGFQVRIVDVDPQRRSVQSLGDVPIGGDTYVVIMTAEAGADEQVLAQIVEKPAAYIGMIGSRNKVKIIFQHLQEAGVPPQALERVHAPIGLDLGGREPAQVALAVLAEMVMVRYGGSGRPLCRQRPEVG